MMFNVITVIICRTDAQLPRLLPQGTTLPADEVSYRTVQFMHGKGEPHFLATELELGSYSCVAS